MNSEEKNSKPLHKFLSYRAKHTFNYAGVRIPKEKKDFEVWNRKIDAKLKVLTRTHEEVYGEDFIPDLGRQNFERFLDEEGRRDRRIIDIPDAAYGEGNTELLGLVVEIIDSHHKPSIQAALASMEVDLDWIVWESKSCETDTCRRRLRRLRRAIELVAAAFVDEAETKQIWHCSQVSSIYVPVKSAYEELMKFITSRPETIYELRSRQFEGLIAEVLKGFGWEVELTQETHDGGYDILAVTKDVDGSGVRASYVIECKMTQPKRKVGIAVARQLLYVKTELKASHAILVTTSDFTKGVYEYAGKRLDFDAKNFEAIIEWCRYYSRLSEGDTDGIPKPRFR